MDFWEVVRRRRMIRTYLERPVAPDLVDRVVDAALRAPSAGHSQGVSVVVLERQEHRDRFWAATARPDGPATPGGRWDRLRQAPVVLLPLAHKETYLARYAEPDKAGLGMDAETGWPRPYWDIDAGFAVMSMLLAATDLGLGALFLAIAYGEPAFLTELGVPEGHEPIGALTLGWPAPDDPPSASAARGRRPRDEAVHYGRWGAARRSS